MYIVKCVACMETYNNIHIRRYCFILFNQDKSKPRYFHLGTFYKAAVVIIPVLIPVQATCTTITIITELGIRNQSLDQIFISNIQVLIHIESNERKISERFDMAKQLIISVLKQKQIHIINSYKHLAHLAHLFWLYSLMYTYSAHKKQKLYPV